MITYDHRLYIELAVKCILNQETDLGVELVIVEISRRLKLAGFREIKSFVSHRLVVPV